MTRAAPTAAGGSASGALAGVARLDLTVGTRPDAPTRLTLCRAWPRSPRHVLLEYADPNGARIAGQWFSDGCGGPDRDRLAAVARETSAASAPDRRRGCRRPRVVVLDSRGVLLQPGGADRRLPRLAALVARPAATLVGHRPERRAVVRLDHGTATTYAKVVHPKRVAGLLRAAQAAGAVGRLRVAELLDWNAASGLTLWARLPGRPLTDLLRDDSLESAARAAGRALRALHVPHPHGAPVAAHTAADEAAVVDRWVRLVQAFLPSGVLDAGDRAGWVRARLLAQPPCGPTLIHRDCYDKQLLIDDDGRVGMLDFDTLAVGEPALDLANLLVHLEVRVRQQRCDPARALAAGDALLDGYGPDTAVLRRLPPYAAAARLRLACVYALRPAWAQLPGRLTAHLDAPVPGAGA